MNGQFNIGDISPTKYFFGIAVLLGLLFSFIGPDSPGQWDGLRSLLQWQFQTVTPMCFLVGTHILLHRLSRFDRLNGWVKLTISGIFAALLFSPLALLIDYYLLNETFDKTSFVYEWLDELAGVLPPIVISWVAINAPWLLGYRLDKKSEETEEVVSEEIDSKPQLLSQQAEPAFFSLLPTSVKGEVIYLKAELHYVEVNTVNGKALILYNLKDAISELAIDLGVQSHRSYWFNKNHLKKIVKNSRQGVVELSNGATVPISRNNFSKVKSLLP